MAGPTPAGAVIARPIGKTRAKGSVTTTDTFATVTGCTITVTKDKTFHPAKVIFSCDQDAVAIIRWNGTQISPEYKMSAKLPVTDWFPWDWYRCEGDGSKAIDVQAKYPSGGAAGDFHAEICGEEV